MYFNSLKSGSRHETLQNIAFFVSPCASLYLRTVVLLHTGEYLGGITFDPVPYMMIIRPLYLYYSFNIVSSGISVSSNTK